MTIFSDLTLIKIVIAILIKRLGGEIKITQNDIDEIAFLTLTEDGYEDGSIGLKLDMSKFQQLDSSHE